MDGTGCLALSPETSGKKTATDIAQNCPRRLDFIANTFPVDERMASRADTDPKEKTGKGQREKNSMLGKKNKQKRGTRMRRDTEGENE